jgi:hypothetical protein
VAGKWGWESCFAHTGYLCYHIYQLGAGDCRLQAAGECALYGSDRAVRTERAPMGGACPEKLSAFADRVITVFHGIPYPEIKEERLARKGLQPLSIGLSR